MFRITWSPELEAKLVAAIICEAKKYSGRDTSEIYPALIRLMMPRIVAG